MAKKLDLIGGRRIRSIEVACGERDPRFLGIRGAWRSIEPCQDADATLGPHEVIDREGAAKERTTREQ
jgi:hypothetical protein